MAEGGVALLAGVCFLDRAAFHAHALVDRRRNTGEEHGLSVSSAMCFVFDRQDGSTSIESAGRLASVNAARPGSGDVVGLNLDGMERSRRPQHAGIDLLHDRLGGFRSIRLLRHSVGIRCARIFTAAGSRVFSGGTLVHGAILYRPWLTRSLGPNFERFRNRARARPTI